MLQYPGVCHQLSQAAALVRRFDQCPADVVNQPGAHEFREAGRALPDGAYGLITRGLQDESRVCIQQHSVRKGWTTVQRNKAEGGAGVANHNCRCRRAVVVGVKQVTNEHDAASFTITRIQEAARTMPNGGRPTASS
jgi:hypothetical protein